MNRFIICILLLFTAGILMPLRQGMADLFMWTDDRGIRHYSNIAPPESVKSTRTREQIITVPNGFSCRVVKVYDGDTIRVKGDTLAFKVRLAGIDSPESGWNEMPEQPFAKEAKEALTRMILHKPVILKQHGVGGYNRVLAEVFFGSRNINLAMVRQGLAEVYTGRLPDSLNIAELRQAEKEARRKGLGIWSTDAPYVSPRIWRKRFQHR